MTPSFFSSSLIEEHIKLSKNKINSKFSETLRRILSEEEVADGTISSPPDASVIGAQTPVIPAPQIPDEATELPPEDADIQIKLAKLAALSLLTSIDKVLSKHPEIRRDEIILSKLKDSGISGREDSLKGLEKILKIVKLGGNDPGFYIDEEFVKKFDPAANDAITNLIIKVLFISKDKILQNNDSLRAVLDDIGSLQSQLKSVEKADPVTASGIAKQIVRKINNDIIPSADLTI
jgi:hypothetical protein